MTGERNSRDARQSFCRARSSKRRRKKTMRQSYRELNRRRTLAGYVVLARLALAATSLVAAIGDENWDDRFAPTGVGSSALAVAVSGTDVYVGDSKWNGRSWSTLGTGLTNSP